MWGLLVVCFLLLTWIPDTDAEVTNGGFESGELTGWTTIGDVSAVDALIGSGPTEGLSQALLSTISDQAELGENFTFSGNDAVSTAELEGFLGLAPGSLDGLDTQQGSVAIEGSALRQTFSAQAGDVLSFDFEFLSTEGQDAFQGENDVVFVSLSPVLALADTFTLLDPSGLALDLLFDDPAFTAGFGTFSMVIPAAGHYTLGIGIIDVGDEFLPSGVLVDNVVVTSSAAPSDLDGDGDVTMADITIVVNCFGQSVADNPACAIADVAPPPDGDGVVNILDVSFVASNFTP